MLSCAQSPVLVTIIANKNNKTLTAITSGFTPRYFPFPHPTSASMLPGVSEDRKWHTRGQGEWRVLLKWGAMELYTACTYSSSNRAASIWQVGSEGSDSTGADDTFWLSQTEGKAKGRIGEEEDKQNVNNCFKITWLVGKARMESHHSDMGRVWSCGM